MTVRKSSPWLKINWLRAKVNGSGYFIWSHYLNRPLYSEGLQWAGELLWWDWGPPGYPEDGNQGALLLDTCWCC